MSPDDRVRKLLEEGLFCLGLSNEDEALDRWRAALEVDPNSVRARRYINFVLQERGEVIPEEVAIEAADASPDSLDVSSGVYEQIVGGGVVPLARIGELSPADSEPLIRPASVTAPEPETAEEDDTAMLISGDTAPLFLPAEVIEGMEMPEATIRDAPAAEESAEEPAEEPAEVLPSPALPEKLPEAVAPPAADADQVDLPVEANPLYQGAVDLFEAGDYSEAMSLVDKVLASEADNADALALLERVREALLTQYKARIGTLSQTPRVNVPDGDLVWLNLDPRAAFLLSRVDGILTFEEIIDLSNLDLFTANKLLYDFLQEGLISVSD